MSNILYLTQRLPFPPNKGEKIRVYNQIKYLKQHGYDITLVSLFDDDQDIALSEQLAKNMDISVYLLPISNKYIGYLKGLVQNKPLSVSHFYNKESQKKIDQLLANNIDLMVCSSSAVSEYYLKSYLPEKPGLIADFMDLDSLKWQQYCGKVNYLYQLIYTRESKLLAKHEKVIQSKSKYCLFTSSTEVQLFKNSIPEADNLQVIGNGLDTDFFKPISKSPINDAPTLLFTGVMDYFPNEDGVIWFVENVWQSVLDRWPKAIFYIAGMNPTGKVQALKRFPGVKVTGYVDDIRKYYDLADIFIGPLRIARGVQNKVLEAFACKLPCITTEVAIQGINCQANEHVLIANNRTEFVTHIENLVNDNSLRNLLGNNAFKLINQEYTWHTHLQKLNHLMKQGLPHCEPS